MDLKSRADMPIHKHFVLSALDTLDFDVDLHSLIQAAEGIYIRLRYT